jgi:ribosomal protein L35AE/L33A
VITIKDCAGADMNVTIGAHVRAFHPATLGVAHRGKVAQIRQDSGMVRVDFAPLYGRVNGRKVTAFWLPLNHICKVF